MENNLVRYILSPLVHVELLFTTEYDKLISLCKKIGVRKYRVMLTVTGRYLYSVTPQRAVFYSELNIYDDKTLRNFLRTPDYREFLVFKMLDMYIKVEDVPNKEVAGQVSDNLQSSDFFRTFFE